MVIIMVGDHSCECTEERVSVTANTKEDGQTCFIVRRLKKQKKQLK